MNQQWPPGWYPDPHGGPGRRYWDGQQWTQHTEAPAAAPPKWAPPPPKKNSGKTAVIIVAAIIGVAVIASAASESGDDSSPTDTEETASKTEKSDEERDKPEDKGKEDCTFKATDDCTPHVGPNGKVRVDALIWRLVSAETATTLGNVQYGLGEKANGVFVVVKLKVTSTKTESVTLSDNVVGLRAKGGNTYEADNDGTVAAIGAGEEPFFLEEVGPDTTLTGTVVFDVPRKILSQDPELSFGELGFGSTKGYIKLPPLGT